MAKFLLVRRKAAIDVIMILRVVATTTTMIVTLYPVRIEGRSRTAAYAAKLKPFGQSMRDAELPTISLESEQVTQYQNG